MKHHIQDTAFVDMHTYLYSAINISGASISGEITAPNRHEAISMLRQKNLRAVSLWNRQSKIRLLLAGFFGVTDLAFISSALASMVTAGLPLADSLELLSKRPEHSAVRRILQSIAAKIRGGVSIPDAFGAYPETFSLFFRSMLQAGQSKGQLGKSLLKIARYYEHVCSIQNKLRSALFYPLLFSSMAIVVLALLLLIIVPKFALFFSLYNIQPPLSTKMIIAASLWLRQNIMTVFISGLIVLTLLILIGKVKLYKKISKFLKIRPGFIFALNRKVLISNLLHQFSALQSFGIDSSDAAKISIRSIWGENREDVTVKHGKQMQWQGRIAALFGQTGLFPAMLLQLIANSEDKEGMNEIIETISRFYYEEVEATVDAFNAVVEPVIIFITGLVAIAVIISMYLPISSISSFL